MQAAAETSAVVRRLVDDGTVFHPLAWSPTLAYQFLKDIPRFEAAGVGASDTSAPGQSATTCTTHAILCSTNRARPASETRLIDKKMSPFKADRTIVSRYAQGGLASGQGIRRDFAFSEETYRVRAALSSDHRALVERTSVMVTHGSLSLAGSPGGDGGLPWVQMVACW